MENPTYCMHICVYMCVCIDPLWGVANILSGPAWLSRTTDIDDIERSMRCQRMPLQVLGALLLPVAKINRTDSCWPMLTPLPKQEKMIAVNPNLSFSYGKILLWPNRWRLYKQGQAPHLASSWRRKSSPRWCTPCETSEKKEEQIQLLSGLAAAFTDIVVEIPGCVGIFYSNHYYGSKSPTYNKTYKSQFNSNFAKHAVLTLSCAKLPPWSTRTIRDILLDLRSCIALRPVAVAGVPRGLMEWVQQSQGLRENPQKTAFF